MGNAAGVGLKVCSCWEQSFASAIGNDCKVPESAFRACAEPDRRTTASGRNSKSPDRLVLGALLNGSIAGSGNAATGPFAERQVLISQVLISDVYVVAVLEHLFALSAVDP